MEIRRTTVVAAGKGHWEVDFVDGFCVIGFYDKTLGEVMKNIANQIPYREPKSITWVEEDKYRI